MFMVGRPGDAPVFVDTNVIVYRFGTTDPRKQSRAVNWFALLWNRRSGRVSFQVLQEAYAALTRKLKPAVAAADAQRIVQGLAAWQPATLELRIPERARLLQERHLLSWRDALIVAAAQTCGCEVLLTEELRSTGTHSTKSAWSARSRRRRRFWNRWRRERRRSDCRVTPHARRMTAMDDRRLIEDYLPLDILNAIASREKLHPRRYMELVHYWPARRPTTASRAAIRATLVPAPRSGVERRDAASFITRLAAFKPAPGIVEEAGDRIGKAPRYLYRSPAASRW